MPYRIKLGTITEDAADKLIKFSKTKLEYFYFFYTQLNVSGKVK